MWSDVTEVKRDNQSRSVASQLPTFDEINKINFRERKNNEIDRTQMKSNNGLKVFIDFFDAIYKEDDLALFLREVD